MKPLDDGVLMRPFLLKLFVFLTFSAQACSASPGARSSTTTGNAPMTSGHHSPSKLEPTRRHGMAWSAKTSRKAKAHASAKKAKPSPAHQQRAQPQLLRHCKERRRIVVFKAQRRLELHCGTKLVGRYAVSLGFEPLGHKRREGDGRTPEGIYGIAFKHHGQFHRALRLSYPNRSDAEAGLRDGRISREEYKAIQASHRRCVQPPQTTKLGSLLEIHGGGSAGDWTLGCVALENATIEKVYRFHRAGCLADGSPRTPVHIHP